MKKRKILFSLFVTLLCAVLSVLLIGILCFQDPVVTHYRVETEGLENDIKIVLLADLHARLSSETYGELSQMVAGQEPDIIVLVGDLIDRDSTDGQIAQVCRFTQTLSQIAPVYYSLGNHEQIYIARHGASFLEDIRLSGVTVLDDAYLDLSLGESVIRLGGMDRYAYRGGNGEFFPGAAEFLSEFCDTGLPKILLSHRPESFSFKSACEEWDVDLILSGHTHGGLVRLPWVGGLVAPIQGFFPKTVYGEYTFFDTKMIVTSGISGYSWIPRVFNPPEICVITLTKPNEIEGS